MTARRRTVARELVPEPQEAAAIAELKTLIGGQQEATGDLRERVKVLESESKHYATRADLAKDYATKADLAKDYATKADLANMKAWVAGAFLSVLVALGAAFIRSSSGN